MNGLAQAERLYDGRLPEAYFVAIDDEIPPARGMVGDSDVEDFIEDLVATDDPAAFLETAANQHFDESGDFDLHVAVARQWVADKESVGGIIGPVFWKWATACAYEVAA